MKKKESERKRTEAYVSPELMLYKKQKWILRDYFQEFWDLFQSASDEMLLFEYQVILSAFLSTKFVLFWAKDCWALASTFEL